MSNIPRFSQTTNVTTNGDINSPYTFQEWIKRNTGIISGRERAQYEQYVTTWYKTRSEASTNITSKLKQDYIALVRQLALSFRTEDEANWISGINFDDDFELEQAIPFFARKLKEIAVYIARKRDAIQTAKLKYNMAGTQQSLEKIFYEYLLKAFTKTKFPGNEYLTNISEVSTVAAIPELSAVTGSFQLQIQELYDRTEYFDKNPSRQASEYFNLSSSNVIEYLTAKGINTSDFEWLYHTGFAQLCADNPMFWVVDDVLNQYDNGIPLSAVETYDSAILNDYNRIRLAKKYMGSDVYNMSGGFFTPNIESYSYNLVPGNNWFYWVEGEYAQQNITSIPYAPLPLSSTNLASNGAIGGKSYQDSDTIFLQRGNSVSAAWLQQTDNLSINTEMFARLQPGKSIFRFPWPGYGLSGEDVNWTGRDTTNADRTFDYLDDEIKTAIKQLYWNTLTPETSTFSSINLNDTQLIANGAKASSSYSTADKVEIRVEGVTDGSVDGIYTGEIEHNWLYRMSKTDIPIAVKENKIQWPLERYSTQTSIISPSSQCAPQYLSAIDIQSFYASIAGESPVEADTIIKYDTPNKGRVIGGAWLSGGRVAISNITDSVVLSGAQQPGISFIVSGGSSVMFVWNQSTQSADRVFSGYSHQRGCVYDVGNKTSWLKNRNDVEESVAWKKCNCLAVVYSPIGHPGESFDQYEGIADYITTVSSPLSTFQLDAWRDSTGNTYKTSSEFGWYKLLTSSDIDIGTGTGEWVTYSGSPFMLSANNLYRYTRTSIKRADPETTAPHYVARYKVSNTNHKWVGMTYEDTTDRWISTDSISDLILSPGDYIVYTHKETNNIVLSGQYVESVPTVVYTLPTLSAMSFTSSLTSLNAETQTIYLSTGYGVSAITIPAVNPSTPTVLSGSYIVNNNFTTSPVISSVSVIRGRISEIKTPAANFMLNIDLSGWNYNTNSYDVTSSGGRPFWAKATDNGGNGTRYKGINVWGGAPYIVDGYNFKTQPDVSTSVLGTDTYIEYTRIDNTNVIWREPITVAVDNNIRQWKKLIIDSSAVSNLSSILYNTVNDLVVSASTETSDLVLDIVDGSPLLVNYYANSGLVWNQEVTNTSLGFPPTGGVWVPVVSGDLITANRPYTNLTNKHFPTIATTPYIGGVYSEEDVGGYFTPQHLGVTTYFNKYRQSILDPLDTISYEVSARGLTTTFRLPNSFGNGIGSSLQVNTTPLSTISIDSRWLKSGPGTGVKTGTPSNIYNATWMTPYQTKYETAKVNDHGIRKQNDKYDPWYGDLDETWENSADWPANFKGQNDITNWYAQYNIGDRQIYQWKTDIYGNQYMLLKNLPNKTIATKRSELGELWTRDARSIIRPASASLTLVYDKFTDTVNTNIIDFDVWFDILYVYTPGYITLSKLNFDYTENSIYAIADNVRELWLCGSVHAGYWLFEEDKNVTLCTLVTGNSAGMWFYPKVFKYDIDSSELSFMFNGSGYTQLQEITSLGLTAIDAPVLTYNVDTQYFNIAFTAYSTVKTGTHIISIDLRKEFDTYSVVKMNAITPTE